MPAANGMEIERLHVRIGQTERWRWLSGLEHVLFLS
jgi:hypothetical protein